MGMKFGRLVSSVGRTLSQALNGSRITQLTLYILIGVRCYYLFPLSKVEVSE
ncbi:protein of unknown function [Vibrio tapetis subsp. tapetis]|uniref:Uncharacterized protein n=1 Tax=Vibrio tapetis subsp. tapetis TaxID=1671868 RepID=A0A2N8Z989_9VIBR|nr:protein of unknown function [Vibrio tapetis subsp. tapetis]